MNAKTLKAVQEEREHCIRLIEAPIPGLRALASMQKDPKYVEGHIKALIEAATCVRDSGAFRDACELRKSAGR